MKTRQGALGSSMTILVYFLFVPAVIAETDAELAKKAMQEYAAGNYADSAGHLFETLSTKFNDPSIHYYLAHCYVHLKDRDSAIREFRIAHALAPMSDIGKGALAALKSYAVTADGFTGNDLERSQMTTEALNKIPPNAGRPLAKTQEQSKQANSSQSDADKRMADETQNGSSGQVMPNSQGSSFDIQRQDSNVYVRYYLPWPANKRDQRTGPVISKCVFSLQMYD